MSCILRITLSMKISMKWFKIIGSLLVLCLICAGASAYWFIFKDLPSVEDLRNVEPTKLSRLIGADGSTIAYFPPEGMIILAQDEIPELVKQAFIAAEDATFYEHDGLDYTRIMAALITDIRAASFVQGASTITQQVVRSYLLTREKTITRKLREVVLAIRIEKTLSKDEILTLYLGRLYLGSGSYGVGAASLRYFGKECHELDLSEISLLAGLAPAPARYSPLNNFQAAKRRQKYVLARMYQEGFITEAAAKDAFDQPLKITAEPVAKFTRYPYITDHIKSMVIERYGLDILDKGVSIQTSIVPAIQDQAIKAAFKGAIDLELRQGNYRGPVAELNETRKQRHLALQQNQLAWKGIQPYELYWAQVTSLEPLTVDLGGQSEELDEKAYAWINPKESWVPSEHLKAGDMIKVCHTDKGLVISQDPEVQAALALIDINDAAVIAMVGGIDYARNQFNRAINAQRQSGSAIKPFIYAAAIDKGMTPATILFDTPITYKNEEDDNVWRPKNYEDKFYGATSLRTGLVLSRNVVTIKLLKEMGLGYTIDYLNRFNLGPNLPRDLSLALGSGVIAPFDLIKSYGVFANQGRRLEPRLIDYITQDGIGPIYTARKDDLLEMKSSDDDNSQVISEQTAFITTNMLTDVVSKGTGWRARALKRPVAGKTGTSNDNRDAWFLGYTTDMLCGVWVGFDNMMPLGKHETGSRAASPIFTDVMQAALKDKPARDFNVPTGIVFAKVDKQTGKLAGPNSSDVKFECFVEGNLPPKSEDTPDEDLLKELF